MSAIKISYFDIKGRAEPVRLALTIGGVAFEDDRVKREEFIKQKKGGMLPFGQLPTLTVDGVLYTQTAGMLRWAGKTAGLYPEDATAGMNVDEVMGVSDDILTAMFKYRGPDKEELKKAREAFVETEMPRLFGGLEKIVKEKSKSEVWLAGREISIADLSIYYGVGNIKNGFVDHVPGSALDQYPRILASYNAVLEHPAVKEWNEKHPW